MLGVFLGSNPICFPTWEPRTNGPSLCRRLLCSSKFSILCVHLFLTFTRDGCKSVSIPCVVSVCTTRRVLWGLTPFIRPQNHSGEVGPPQQVPHEPQGGKLLLQKPSSKAGGTTGESLHCGHQVWTNVKDISLHAAVNIHTIYC